MSREIKFRAWDGLRITTSGIQFSTTDGKLTMIQDYPLMQFTGLKDKNDKEIYEGDILKCDDDKLRQITWYELGAGWRVGINDKDTYFNGLGVYANTFQVLGNIYENPELLENHD